MRKSKLKRRAFQSLSLFIGCLAAGLGVFFLSQTISTSTASAHEVIDFTGSTHYNSWRWTETKTTYSGCSIGGCSGSDTNERIWYKRNQTCGYFVPYMSNPNEYGCNHTNETVEEWDGTTKTVTKKEFIPDGHRTGAPHQRGPIDHEHPAETTTTSTTSTTVAPVGDTTTSSSTTSTSTTSTTVAQTF